MNRIPEISLCKKELDFRSAYEYILLLNALKRMSWISIYDLLSNLNSRTWSSTNEYDPIGT